MITKIEEILELPDIDTMSDEELTKLLEPFIPEARKPNAQALIENEQELLHRVQQALLKP